MQRTLPARPRAGLRDRVLDAIAGVALGHYVAGGRVSWGTAALMVLAVVLLSPVVLIGGVIDGLAAAVSRLVRKALPLPW